MSIPRWLVNGPEMGLTITSNFDGANELAIDLFQPTMVDDDADTGEVDFSESDVTSIRQGIIDTTVLTSADLENAAEIVTEFNNGATANLGDGSLDRTGNDISAAQFGYRFWAATDGGSDNADDEVNYSTINVGTGSDIVVLHSNEDSANTLVFDGEFDKLTVVNFFDDAARTITGSHILDFTAFLDNQQDPSNAPANNLQSAVTIPITYDGPETAAVGDDLLANEITVLKPDFDAVDGFAGLTDTNFLAAINGDDATTDYADIDDNSLDAADSIFADDFVGTEQDHIVFVENDANRGEYKVFHLTSALDVNGDVDNLDGDFATANLLGTIDFGAEITGDPIGEGNFWGSEDPNGDGTSWSSFYLNDVLEGEGAGDDDDDDDAVAVNATTAAAGELDAAGDDFIFDVESDDYTQEIVNFTAGDVLNFPEDNDPTVVNTDFTDGIVDVQYAADGKVTIIQLTGLDAAIDEQLLGIESFDDVFGEGTITSGTIVVGDDDDDDDTPEDTETVDADTAAEGALSAADADVTFEIAGGDTYTQEITDFAAGDVLDFPEDNDPTVVNTDFTDGIVDVQYAFGGNVVTIQLTGLDAAIDQQLLGVQSFDDVFGEGTII